MNIKRRRRANHTLKPMTQEEKSVRTQRKMERGNRNSYSWWRRQRARQSAWVLAEEARRLES